MIPDSGKQRWTTGKLSLPIIPSPLGFITSVFSCNREEIIKTHRKRRFRPSGAFSYIFLFSVLRAASVFQFLPG